MELIVSKRPSPLLEEFLKFLEREGYITIDVRSRGKFKILKMERIKKKGGKLKNGK
jgi:3-mercaptopyruvate sulfurtransferase SseA